MRGRCVCVTVEESWWCTKEPGLSSGFELHEDLAQTEEGVAPVTSRTSRVDWRWRLVLLKQKEDEPLVNYDNINKGQEVWLLIDHLWTGSDSRRWSSLDWILFAVLRLCRHVRVGSVAIRARKTFFVLSITSFNKWLGSERHNLSVSPADKVVCCLSFCSTKS